MKVTSCIVVALLSSGLSYRASTGYSFADIRMLPVAVGANSTVLFKTYFQVNSTGGTPYAPVEMGWLVASAKGIWDYRKKLRLTFDEGNFISAADSVHLNGFSAPFQLDPNDTALDSLVKEHQIRLKIAHDAGRNTMVWKREGIFKKDHALSQSNSVRSLFDLVNDPAAGNEIGCTFYYKGIVLFHSEQRLNEKEDDVIVTGPRYYNGTIYQGAEWWIDVYQIDGLVFLDR